MIGGVWLGNSGKLVSLGLPVVRTRIDDGASERNPMTTNPLCERLEHDCSAILRRTVEIRGREGVVNKDGHGLRERACRLDECGNVGHVDERVAYGLHVP